MKKKRLTGILALASCVTLLTGCNPDALWGLGEYWNQVADGTVGFFNDIAVKLGLKEAEKKDEKKEEEKKDEGKEEEQHEEEKVPSMVVGQLPEKLYVGEELDLSEFVELQNASDFTVEVAAASKKLASAEGHVLKGLGEGEINFTIKSGELAQACKIQGIRESRDALISFFEGVENRYSVVAYHEYQVAGEDTTEDETDDEYDWFMDDLIFHDTNYILSLGSWDEDDEGNAIPGGFVRFGEEALECFTFSLLEDDEGEEYVELGDQLPRLYFDSYNPSFGVDFSEAKYEYDSDYEMELYVIEDKDAKWFAEESLFIPNGTPYTGYPVSRVEFNIYDEAEEGEEQSLAVDAYVYITYKGSPYLVEIATLYTDEESVGYPLLQEYAVAENLPEFDDYWEYFGEGFGFDQFFLNPESYVGPSGLVSLDYGWCDDEGKAIDCPSDATTVNLFAYMPVGSKTLLLSENSIWEVDDEYNPLSGKMVVKGEGEEDPDVTYNIYAADTESGYFAEEADEGVWEEKGLFFGGLSDKSNYAPGTIVAAQDITHEEPVVDEETGEETGETETVYDGTVFSIGFLKNADLIDALIAGDSGLYNLGAIIESYAEVGSDLLSYFNGMLFVDPYSGIVQLSLQFGWDDNVNWAVTFTSVYYPGMASMAASYEGYMIANVIAAE